MHVYTFMLLDKVSIYTTTKRIIRINIDREMSILSLKIGNFYVISYELMATVVKFTCSFKHIKITNTFSLKMKIIVYFKICKIGCGPNTFVHYCFHPISDERHWIFLQYYCNKWHRIPLTILFSKLHSPSSQNITIIPAYMYNSYVNHQHTAIEVRLKCSTS